MAERFIAFLQSPRTRRNALLAAVWIAGLWFLFSVREVLVPFWLAVALAYVIDPLVGKLSRRPVAGRYLPRWLSVAVIYLGIFCLGWLLAVFFVPQLYKEVARLAKDGTAYVETIDEQQIEEWSAGVDDFFQRLRLPVRIETRVSPKYGPPSEGVELEEGQGDAILTVNLADLAKGALEQGRRLVEEELTSIFGRVQGVVARVVGTFFSFFLVLMICAFISISTEQIRASLFALVPKERQGAFGAFLTRVGSGLSGVIRGQLTICLVNGALTLVGLLILQVKFAFILATVAMVFSLIPIFGSILSTIPIVLVSLASGFFTALFALFWILFIHFVEANFLNPKIMGDAAKIHPVIIVLALVVGEHYYGLVGALFAVPVASFILTVYRSIQAKVADLDDRVADGEADPPPPVRARPPRIIRDPLA